MDVAGGDYMHGAESVAVTNPKRSSRYGVVPGVDGVSQCTRNTICWYRIIKKGLHVSYIDYGLPEAGQQRLGRITLVSLFQQHLRLFLLSFIQLFIYSRLVVVDNDPDMHGLGLMLFIIFKLKEN